MTSEITTCFRGHQRSSVSGTLKGSADQKRAVFQDLTAGLNRIKSSDSDIEVLPISPRSKVK